MITIGSYHTCRVTETVALSTAPQKFSVSVLPGQSMSVSPSFVTTSQESMCLVVDTLNNVYKVIAENGKTFFISENDFLEEKQNI